MQELKNIKVDLIDPLKIIDKNNSNDIDNFFLTLGLIYNDLKGLIIFYRHCKEKYVIKKDNEGLTFKNSELAGLQLQIQRLMIGLVRETIKFIYKKRLIIESSE